uniref:Uncharacterized protein n=1 Tax=Branchiostoma floridae TaxID=7739 RepID=C3YQX5_BRAFL|eukprot:XP_002601304.1 hypothetical protein BRAFLDRAFT_81344 [Branchiostoma floridae]
MKLAPSAPFFLLFSWLVFVSAATTNNGMYVCFFLEMLPMLGTNRARLTSPIINTTQQVVMSFAIGTVRPPTGPYLNVILVNQTGTETLLCSTSDLLLPWQRLYVGVVQPGPYQIVIEGIPDPPFYPNFGIDDLTLTSVQNVATDVATGCSCAASCPPVGTSSPDGSPVVASFRSSSGVDPAVCAGIAITTAAVGAVVGVLATLLNLHLLGINKARFISPTINTTRHVVMSFAIGTVRPPDAIYMNIITADEHGGGEELVCSTSDLLLPWQRIQVGIGMSGPYKIIIEGVSNPPFYPNFGIDDVTLTVADPGTTTAGAPTAKCSLQVTTPSMSTVTEAVQGGTPGQSDIVLVPIVLGSAGGLLIVGLGAFLLWRKYVRKVSPESGEL